MRRHKRGDRGEEAETRDAEVGEQRHGVRDEEVETIIQT